MVIGRTPRFLATAFAVTLAAGLLVATLTGCASPQNGDKTGDNTTPQEQASMQSITDMRGRTVEVPTNAQRIIGIGSSSLRVVSYLEATDKVVGIEQSETGDKVTCSYRHVYHDTFKDLPVIGEGGSKGVTPNEEAIMQVAPDVIFASIDKDAADSLQEKTNIPVVCLTLSDIVFDQVFYDNIELVGSIVGKQSRADDIVKYMKDTQSDLEARTSNISEADRKTAYAAGISFRGGHGFAGTEANFPPFQEANVKNVADVNGANGAFDIDLEAVTNAQPDYLFVESGNLPLVKEDYDNNPSYFAALNAVQSGNTYTLIAYRFYATNIELALANCYQVGAVVYPEQFKDINPTDKLDEITEFFLGKKLSGDLAQEGCTFKQIDLTQK
ncbi:MAG: ABC transporter substrate-binding protein [Gordonibacter sp.]|nr:ABC transporter substrate-binding protein [Gordonibacter sp.]